MIKILQAQNKKDSDYIPYSKLKGNDLQNAVVSLVKKEKANIIDTIDKLNNESEKQIDDKIIQSVFKVKRDKKDVTDVLQDTISKLETLNLRTVITPDKKESPVVESKERDKAISDLLNDTISKLETMTLKKETGGKKKKNISRKRKQSRRKI